jgi:PAS domain S-box-containing protein
MRVLIVEDNDHDRLLLKYILEENGFEVVEAEDGIDGFEKAFRHKPDMIISDANMPRMDGFQFLRKIKQDDALKSIPFVFYSAVYTGYREAELAISLGAEAFIIKPKEATEFLDELKIIMEESGKKRPVTAELIEKDEEYLRQYSEIVVTKLEEKIRELENALSEIRQKEESLRESEARLQSIFRAAPVGIGLVSERRILLQVNERLCQMTGFSDEELVGMNSRILYPSDEDFEYVGNEKYAQIRDKGTGTVETRWKRKDGSIIYIILSSSPIDPEDLSRGVTFTALDITERKHSEEALKNKEKELKKRVRELEDFYSMAVGRELRMRELKDNIRENQEEIESLKKRLGKYEKID